jgi:hypothetical protein
MNMAYMVSIFFSVMSENGVTPGAALMARSASMSCAAREYSPVHITVSAASEPTNIRKLTSACACAAANARSIHCFMSRRCGWRSVSAMNMLQATRASTAGEGSGTPPLSASSSTAIQRSSSEQSSSSYRIANMAPEAASTVPTPSPALRKRSNAFS